MNDFVHLQGAQWISYDSNLIIMPTLWLPSLAMLTTPLTTSPGWQVLSPYAACWNPAKLEGDVCVHGVARDAFKSTMSPQKWKEPDKPWGRQAADSSPYSSATVSVL